MAKFKQRIDPAQTSILDLVARYHESETKQPIEGSMDIDRRFRESVNEGIKKCPLSRYQIAARMSELTGTDITKTMLDSWTAESKEGHRFPAIFLPAFCDTVNYTEPLKLLGMQVGVFVLPGPEALRAEIQKLEEEISRKGAEKRKRMLFLKEMEGK
ncbi:MAG: hypothetical protein LLG40_11355 [Deltaproteobacteria bacterium]|nr:hypothetical protein [Deltaproteobacteria bacterium]